MRVVLILVNDNSLGGTSRSAVEFVSCWRAIGFEVYLSAISPLHPSRRAEAERAGASVISVENLPAVLDVIHLHHSTVDLEVIDYLREILVNYESGVEAPRVLTHNIFAVSDRGLNAVASKRTVGLMSSWCRLQYLNAIGYPIISKPAMIEMPNPQDDRHFRTPTDSEKIAARTRLTGSYRRVLLRVGSPIDSKWHSCYVDLASALPDDTLLVVVGCPANLSGRLEVFDNVQVVNSISDDKLMRDYYWSADLFVHAAAKGETFGNVIHESLLCGTPVLYLERPFRDNSPMALAPVSGFSSKRFVRTWLDGCTAEDGSMVVDRRHLLNMSSRDAVSRRLSFWFNGYGEPSPFESIRWHNVLSVFVTHNVVANLAKQVLHAARRIRRLFSSGA